jgi:hypothetical protein
METAHRNRNEYKLFFPELFGLAGFVDRVHVAVQRGYGGLFTLGAGLRLWSNRENKNPISHRNQVRRVYGDSRRDRYDLT